MIHISIELPNQKVLQLDEEPNGDMKCIIMSKPHKYTEWKQTERFIIPKSRRNLVAKEIQTQE